MSNSAMPWVKMYTNLLEDPRIFRLSPDTQATYFKLTLLAGRCDAGGAYYKDGAPMPDDDIAWSLRMDAKELAKDFKLLTTVGLMINNGHGPELNAFMDIQGPTSHTMNRKEWEKRQIKNRGDVTPRKEPIGYPKGKGKEPKRNRVTPRSRPNNDPKSQSQSQSQIKSQIKRKSQSRLIDSIKRPTDNLNLTISKTFIVENIGIPETQQNQIVGDDAIINVDLLAEFSRNLARKGDGKGKVKNPAYITALNLSKHEYPAADWYDLQKWANYLPDAILENLGIPVPEKKLAPSDPDYRGLN